MRVSGCGWFRGAARRGAPSRSVPWTVPVSALRHQAERRAGKGTPTSGQFSRWGPAQPAAGGRQGRNWATPAGWRCVVSRPSRAAMPVGDPHRENWPALQALSALVSRSRAMPVGDRRSKRCRRWFRAPARCRSETGAPSVVGAGFALPRDAGQRPALQALSALVSRSRAMPVGETGAPSVVGALVSRSRAMPVGDRRSKRCRRWFRAPARCRSETGAPSVVGAGFALPRDAGRRPALQALSALVSRDAGRRDRRSKRCRRWFRAPARCRSETGAPSVVGAGFALPRDAGRSAPTGELAGAPSVVGAGFALPRDAGRRPALQALSLVCRSETGAPSVVGAGFALPRDAGRRPALQALSALVSRSRAMPVGDRRSVSW